MKHLDRTPTWNAIISAAQMGCGFLMLGRGEFTLVDENVMVEVEHLKWGRSSYGYCYRHFGTRKNHQRELLHRRIMNPPSLLEVDHENRNRLDNRRENLRVATSAQNKANKLKMGRRCASNFKGVYYNNGNPNGRLVAMGRVNYKTIYLGTYDTALEAAAAYNAWATATFGEFACLNPL